MSSLSDLFTNFLASVFDSCNPFIKKVWHFRS